MNSEFQPSPLAPRRTPDEQARDRDLGFGSVVSRESRQRLLNRDGSFNVTRQGFGPLGSFAPYHQLLSISWPGFLALFVILYFAFNLLFAVAFVLCGDNALLGPGIDMLGGRFSRAFYFSVQTFATIGYGQIGPNGFLPNFIVTIEALIGLMYQALGTGLLFARFSRPRASIVFSRTAVVAPYNDGVALEFRIANRRRNEIIELEAQVLFSAMQPDGRGGRVRRYTVLPLERNKVVFFPLSWTIVHPIDAGSPLSGKTVQDLQADEVEILVLLSGTDETFEQTVHARSSYRADEIVWNARFRSVFVQSAESERVRVDINRLDDIEELS
ncbi:MAG TPA: ion channel [Vicinamibacterales bacterium]